MEDTQLGISSRVVRPVMWIVRYCVGRCQHGTNWPRYQHSQNYLHTAIDSLERQNSAPNFRTTKWLSSCFD